MREELEVPWPALPLEVLGLMMSLVMAALDKPPAAFGPAVQASTCCVNMQPVM